MAFDRLTACVNDARLAGDNVRPFDDLDAPPQVIVVKAAALLHAIIQPQQPSIQRVHVLAALWASIVCAVLVARSPWLVCDALLLLYPAQLTVRRYRSARDRVVLPTWLQTWWIAFGVSLPFDSAMTSMDDDADAAIYWLFKLHLFAYLMIWWPQDGDGGQQSSTGVQQSVQAKDDTSTAQMITSGEVQVDAEGAHWTAAFVDMPFARVRKPVAGAGAFVALWYKRGEPVMGRVWRAEDTGALAASFPMDGVEHRDGLGTIQVLYYDADHSDFTLSWLPYKDAASGQYSGAAWRPLRVKDCAPCIVGSGRDQFLGKVLISEERASYSHNGKEVTFTGPQVADFLVLCRKDK